MLEDDNFDNTPKMISKMLSCLVLMAVVGVSTAYPRYVAIPLEDLIPEESVYQPLYLTPDGELIPDQDYDGSRQMPSYLAQPSSRNERSEEDERSDRIPRGGGHHHGDIVDYGAYTGGHGAFGWYTDHPVHGHHH